MLPLMLLAGTTVCSDFNYVLIKDYLLYTNVKTVLFITDDFETRIERIKESRNLQTYGIWINHWNALNDSTDFDYDHFFVRSSHQIGIVINFSSNQTPAILHQISKRNMFHFERNWLMFATDNEQAITVLSEENVNVDAQISNVIQFEEK